MKKIKTEERILDVAEQFFRTRGFGGTRMSDIADEAALAPKTLFNYFPSKERLVLALVIRWLERNHVHFREDESPAGELADILPANANFRLDALDEERWLSAMAAAKTDILISYRWNVQSGVKILLANRDARIGRIRLLQAQGRVISTMSPELINKIYEGIRDNILGHWLLMPGSNVADLKADMHQAMEVYLNGIRQTAKGDTGA